MTRIPIIAMVVLVFALGVAVADPSGNNIVINEIYCDGAGYFDGSEFIELYNPTAAPIDVSGWVMLPVSFLILLGIVRALRWALVPLTHYTLAYQDA